VARFGQKTLKGNNTDQGGKGAKRGKIRGMGEKNHMRDRKKSTKQVWKEASHGPIRVALRVDSGGGVLVQWRLTSRGWKTRNDRKKGGRKKPERKRMGKKNDAGAQVPRRPLQWGKEKRIHKGRT